MFKDSTLFGGFAVRDTDMARRFYKDKLGLDVRDGQQPGILEINGTGGAPVIVYPKPDHAPAGFTVLNITVPDIEAAITKLGQAGVTMEHYDNPPMVTDQNGILRDDGQAIAWFKDPDGNILSVIESSRS
jgi:catechol 2,3-dioxygenase-like lactoylglutathione lyase family enzyme